MTGEAIKKRKTYSAPSINVDHGLLEKLNELVSQPSSDLQALIQFIESGSITKLLSIWSFYASTNDHTQFTDISIKLSKLTHQINLSNTLLLTQKPVIIDTYKDILNNHIKVIYRALNNLKPPLTNSNIKILNNLINYDGIIVSEFLNTFDFSLSSLPKLLTPPKSETKPLLQIRFNFISFWLDFCSNVAYFHRSDLLLNHPKIINNFWKFLNSDSIELIQKIIAFLDDKVLGETNFKRSEKCKILSENFMHKVQVIFNKTDESFFIDFMNKLATDSKQGLVFPNDKLWQLPASGVPVQINNKTFKIANKLLFTLLTTLKPGDSNVQLQYMVRILDANPELIPPYMNWSVQHGGGYHEPSLTSWWISHTLLYSNVLQTQLPSFSNPHLLKFDAKLISESIVFAPLSKGSLINGLGSKKPLLVQLTLQLILYMLNRLQLALSTTPTIKQELIDLVLTQLPDLNVIAPIIEQESSSKLIKLTGLTILQKYESFRSSGNNNALNKIVSSGISSIVSDVSSISGYELTLLNLYISIQNEQDFKWWNKGTSGNTFFTSLVRLSTNSNIDKNYVMKIYQLLTGLGQEKMLWNSDVLISPILPLIYSFEGQEIGDKVWNLLDETIARSVRTPYKYLDLSHEKYQDISIFIVALFEQFKFVLKRDNDDITYIKWLFQYLKYLIIIGESKSVLLQLVDSLEIDEIVKANNLVEQLDSVTQGTEESKDSTIVEIVMYKSVDDLIKNNWLEKKVISSNLDFLALVKLLDNALSNGKPAKPLITLLFSKFWNYLMSSADDKVSNYFASKKFWNILFNQGETTSENVELAISLYNEIISTSQFTSDTTELSEFIFEKYLNGQKEGLEQFMWIMSQEQLQKLLLLEGPIFLKAVESCVSKNIKLEFKEFQKLYASYSGNERNALIIQLIDLNLLNFSPEELQQIISSVMTNPSDQFLIANFIQASDDVVTLLKDKLGNIQDSYLNCLIAYSLIKREVDIPLEFHEKVIDISLRLIQQNNLGELKWHELLTILSTSQSISTNIFEQVFLYLEGIGLKHSFILSFIDFISKFESNQEITSWLHKSMLYITKKFAESDQLSKNFDDFVERMGNFLLETNVWSLVPSSILNTQLEVILSSKWNKSSRYLKYVTKLVLVAPKGKIDYQRMFQITLNESDELPNETNSESRFYNNVILYTLFNLDIGRLSTLNNLDHVLEKYLGSSRAEDLLLKDILIKIESKVAVSWLTKVSNWEFIEESVNEDYGFTQDKLIKNSSKGEFTVCLNKGFIKNTFSSYKDLELPSDKTKSAKTKWEQIDQFYQVSNLHNPKLYSATSYDPEFLLMVTLNNEELLQINKEEDGTEKVVFNIKNLIDTGILQFIVSTLSNPKYVPISKIIIAKVLKSITGDDNSFKDKSIYTVYLSNILFTLTHSDNSIPHLVWYVWSQLVPILSNPGHFLYEKSFRYVLSTPKLKSNDVPLYNLITHPRDGESEYYRELTWLIHRITEGVETVDDLAVFQKGIVETFVNIFNSEYGNTKLKSSILKLVYKLQGIDYGSDMLITRFGLLAALEAISVGLTNSLIDKQLKLNIDELLVRFDLGKLTHYSFDLVLISIILAGIHRNTGLQFDVSHFSSVDVRRYFGKYLAFGEACYDKVVSLLKYSGYFRQSNLIYGFAQQASDRFKQETGRSLDEFKRVNKVD
ncbi:Nucleolar pre-ribosomal-associated protein 1 [Spathaspora sp. JA1]|nr:Nucleolar pre-ribosomal-associated protein 1 [Spathaspora sp. JA1]